MSAYSNSYARVLGGEALSLPAAYVALQNAPTRDDGEDAVKHAFRMQQIDRRFTALANGRKRRCLPTEGSES